MTLLYYDSIFQEHETGDHPESGWRILAVVRHLQFLGLDSSCERPAWDPATIDELCYVHTREYVESIRQFAAEGGGNLDDDTVVSEKSFEVARKAVGAVGDAVRRVVAGKASNAFCLVRPPGHHAMPDRAMGFCLFNNVAIAARIATHELALRRVLIIDIDVHHGNGTQAIFWEDADVGYFSIHRASFYPGTGASDEIGAGKGLGTTFNLPIEFGTSRESLMRTFEIGISQFAEHIRPQLVLVSAGFDAHKADTNGSLGLESEDYKRLTRCLLEIAQRHCDGKLVSVLEGGYNRYSLTESVDYHLHELLDAS
ncbi:histone deacetylase [Roseiconus lacunae]|uniref:histone deacetylase family protein n=1 Tax=Roseiconus lacunae TaxID=2605694 RepID=UPI00308E9359|nr:histone deacetylase [Stieleria sp. HD01]